MNPNRRVIAGAAFAALAFGPVLALTAGSAGADGGGHEPVPTRTAAPTDELTGAQRQVIREATRQLRDPAAAAAAGYIPSPECAELPDAGGMGQHWINPVLLMDGGRIDPTMPEVLLFAPGPAGDLELVGVEYMAVVLPGQLTEGAPAPTMLGHPLDGPMPGHEEGMPVHFDLHAWVFTNNPTGDLAAWNPRVTCEAGR